MRIRQEMSFDEIMAKFNDKAMFNIIHRTLHPENFLELSFRTMDTGIDYFLWIILDPIHIPEFTKGCKEIKPVVDFKQ